MEYGLWRSKTRLYDIEKLTDITRNLDCRQARGASTRWLLKPEQDKGMRISHWQTEYNASNYFLRNGEYTPSAEWRFVHRARYNIVPLNGCTRHGRNDKKCRWCVGQNKTPTHVLNHCRSYFSMMTRRQNDIVTCRWRRWECRGCKCIRKPADTRTRRSRETRHHRRRDGGLRKALNSLWMFAHKKMRIGANLSTKAIKPKWTLL